MLNGPVWRDNFDPPTTSNSNKSKFEPGFFSECTQGYIPEFFRGNISACYRRISHTISYMENNDSDSPEVWMRNDENKYAYYIYIYTCYHASSTAQGGGGSFKNMKPIGELGCCESGMAERRHWWTERCLRSPLFLSLWLSTYLPIYLLCIYRSIYLSLSSNYLSIYLYLSLSLSHSFICLPVYLSICGAVSFSVM